MDRGRWWECRQFWSGNIVGARSETSSVRETSATACGDDRHRDRPGCAISIGLASRVGELTVYYPSGRMRYQGELVDGEHCGAWLEDRGENPPADLPTEVMEEIESLAMYPECPDS